jgi:predicted XRE-type DNA-binding protein
MIEAAEALLDRSPCVRDNPVMARKRARRPKVSEQVRRAIAGCGLTRYRISQLTGIDQASLTKFMSGERGLSTTALDTLGELLDLEVVMRGPKRS